MGETKQRKKFFHFTFQTLLSDLKEWGNIYIYCLASTWFMDGAKNIFTNTREKEKPWKVSKWHRMIIPRQLDNLFPMKNSTPLLFLAQIKYKKKYIKFPLLSFIPIYFQLVVEPVEMERTEDEGKYIYIYTFVVLFLLFLFFL